MGEGIVSWFIGPQLIGVVFLLLGWAQKTWPPKKINKYYGYRSDTAMRNQQTWDEGNRYAALFLMKAGIIVLIAGLLLTVLMHFLPTPDKVKFAFTYLLILIATMGTVISMMTATERHLEKTFDGK